MSAARPPAPRIALWGAFDVEECGPQATRRVVEAELLRRLPGASVTAFSPLGRLRPLALDGGRPAEPLPVESPAGLAELRTRFDCILVCGEDSLSDGARAADLWGEGDRVTAATRLLVDGPGADLEDVCPMAWVGVSLGSDPGPERAARLVAAAGRRAPVAVLDQASRRRLAAAGVRGEIELLPPFGLLLPRLLGTDLLRRRGELHRLMEWSWPAGAVLTVQGNARLAGTLQQISAAVLPLVTRGGVQVQLSAGGAHAGEAEFASALDAALDGRCRRLPGVTPPEDQVAAIAGSAAYLGPPGLGLSVARALGIPAVTPALPGDDEDGPAAGLGAEPVAPDRLAAALQRLFVPAASRPAPPAGAIAQLDRHLDGVARFALLAWARRAAAGVPGEAAGGAGDGLLRRAHEERGRRLFADRAAIQAASDAAVEQLRARLDAARAELQAARAENDRIVASRTWRYTQPLRDARARIAGRSG
jgi:hypothetical protein